MEIYQANPLGSYFGGAAMAQQARQGQMDLQSAEAEVVRQNRLQALLATHGAGLVNGDQASLEALASSGFVDQAMDYRGQNHGISMDLRGADQRDRQLGQADRGLEFEGQRVGLQREGLELDRAQFEHTRQTAREQMRRLDLAQLNEQQIAEAEREAESDERLAAQLMQIQDQDTWDRVAPGLFSSNEEEAFSFEDRTVGIAGMVGHIEGFRERLAEAAGTGEISYIATGERAGALGLPDDGRAFNVTSGREGISASSISGTAPASADMSAKEEEIARLMEIPEVDRETAIMIADGVIRVSQDPLTREVTLINTLTGRPWSGQSSAQPEQAAPGAPALDASPQLPQVPQETGLSYGSSFEGGDTAFGASGFGRRVANTAADVAGAPMPFPETASAQADFRVLQDAILQTVSAGYDRQPPSWLMQNLRELAPQSGSIWEGPEAAMDKLESLGRSLSGRVEGIERQLQTPMSPSDATVLRQRAASLREGLGLVDQAIVGIRGPDSSSGTTSSGITWSVE